MSEPVKAMAAGLEELEREVTESPTGEPVRMWFEGEAIYEFSADRQAVAQELSLNLFNPDNFKGDGFKVTMRDMASVVYVCSRPETEQAALIDDIKGTKAAVLLWMKKKGVQVGSDEFEGLVEAFTKSIDGCLGKRYQQESIT